MCSLVDVGKPAGEWHITFRAPDDDAVVEVERISSGFFLQPP